MNTIKVILKASSSPCSELKKFISKLPARYKENIEIFEEGVYTIQELNKMIDSVYQYSYPTIILDSEDEQRVITGFTYRTEHIIVDHLNKNYVIN